MSTHPYSAKIYLSLLPPTHKKCPPTTTQPKYTSTYSHLPIENVFPSPTIENMSLPTPKSPIKNAKDFLQI